MREVTAIDSSHRLGKGQLRLVHRYNRRPLSPDRGGAGSGIESNKEPYEVAYVIAEPCIDTKDNSCVEVCPVDCIHPTPEEPDYDNVTQLFIDPDECIDCDACVEACPVDACFAEDQLPDEWQKYTQINADYYKKG
jgi:ferredoxin